MRYSIMLQLVGFIALVLVGSAALFAWIQNRTVYQPDAAETYQTPSKTLLLMRL
jgi:uncharacterized membrane protein YedE/YeeE